MEDSSARKPLPAGVVRATSQNRYAAPDQAVVWLSAWLAQLTARTHQNISIVALANEIPVSEAQEFGA
jgi:hypothetical protein